MESLSTFYVLIVVRKFFYNNYFTQGMHIAVLCIGIECKKCEEGRMFALKLQRIIRSPIDD